MSAGVVDGRWLVPGRVGAGGDERVWVLPAGMLWDAVRTPEEVALPVLGQLLADGGDRRRLGPVLLDNRSHQVHWLVSPGHSASYPAQCRLIGAGGWLAVPGPGGALGRLAWLHLPEPGTLSAPAWLAAALGSGNAQ